MKTTLYIQNLKCVESKASIINRISAIRGISNITIKLQYGSITFEHETQEAIKELEQIL